MSTLTTTAPVANLPESREQIAAARKPAPKAPAKKAAPKAQTATTKITWKNDGSPTPRARPKAPAYAASAPTASPAAVTAGKRPSRSAAVRPPPWARTSRAAKPRGPSASGTTGARSDRRCSEPCWAQSSAAGSVSPMGGVKLIAWRGRSRSISRRVQRHRRRPSPATATGRWTHDRAGARRGWHRGECGRRVVRDLPRHALTLTETTPR